MRDTRLARDGMDPANGDTATAELVREVRAQGILLKPYTGAALLQVIASTLGVQFHESRATEPPAALPGDLRAARALIPPDIVAELTLAARQARATRLLELADHSGVHSSHAAKAARSLVDDFNYSTLLEAFEEREQDAV